VTSLRDSRIKRGRSRSDSALRREMVAAFLYPFCQTAQWPVCVSERVCVREREREREGEREAMCCVATFLYHLVKRLNGLCVRGRASE